MKPSFLCQFGGNPWINGLRLALLNIMLAAFSGCSFIGVLSFVAWLNRLGLANDSTSSEVPFPYPALMLMYSILFFAAWFLFARRLTNGRRERTITTLVGAGPLFGMSLLGYAGVIGALAFDEFNPGLIPTGSFFVFGGIATLILLAGIACVGMISLVGGRAVTKPSTDSFTASR